MAHDTDNRPLFVNTLNPRVFPSLNIGGAGIGSATWATANTAVIIPFKLPWDYPVARVFWANGSAAGGNWNLAIMDATCATSYYTTGTTAAGTNNLPQFVTPGSTVYLPADTELNLCLALDNITANRLTGATLSIAKLYELQVLEAASSFALTPPLTLATPSGTVLPFAGFTRTASGF